MQRVLIIGLKQGSVVRESHYRDMIAEGNLSITELRSLFESLGELRQKDPAKTYDAIELCQGAHDLVKTAGYLYKLGGAIEVLDILDHGRAGLMELGDEILFRCKERRLTLGRKTAEQLGAFLTDRGQVRLLGCKTALAEDGQCMLVRVAQALGKHRQALGTIERVIPGHFEDGMFSQALDLLFSSVAAIDGAAPDVLARQRSLRRFKPVQ